MGAFVPILGSLVSAVASAAFSPSPPSAPAPPPPPAPPPTPPPVPTDTTSTQPEGVLDAEVAKQNAIRRRRSQQTSLVEDATSTGAVDTKTLLGN